MKKEFVVTLPLNDAQKKALEDVAASHGGGWNFTYTDREDHEAVRSAAILVGEARLPDVRRAASLEWYQLHSAGFDMYCADGILPEGCVLTNAGGLYGPVVSEHMLALTLAVIRRLGIYRDRQSRRKWSAIYSSVPSVAGSTVLVLGLGDIGSRYARAMKTMGAHVIGVKRSPGGSVPGVDELCTTEDLDEVLPRADIIGMVLPGGSATRHIIDARRIALMKKGVYIINVGRGSAIDLSALKEGLRSGQIAGAGLDVTEPEPLPAEDDLWECEDVILTPHVAGRPFYSSVTAALADLAARNFEKYLNGQPLENVVDRRRGY